MTHRHTKSCKHSGRKHTRKSGGKHHHTKRCKHTRGRKRNIRMKGGNSVYPPSSTYPLGVKEPVSNFDFNAASYGNNVISTSNPSAFPFGANSMTGGKRRRSRRHRSRRHRSRRHRGGMGYSFLPSGSDLNAKDSYLANVAPYSVYNE